MPHATRGLSERSGSSSPERKRQSPSASRSRSPHKKNPGAEVQHKGAPKETDRFVLDLRYIVARYDPWDNKLSSCKERYPTLTGSMLAAQLRRIYVCKKVTLPWYTETGQKAFLRHEPRVK
jgi:hypothetical protein